MWLLHARELRTDRTSPVRHPASQVAAAHARMDITKAHAVLGLLELPLRGLWEWWHSLAVTVACDSACI